MLIIRDLKNVKPQTMTRSIHMFSCTLTVLSVWIQACHFYTLHTLEQNAGKLCLGIHVNIYSIAGKGLNMVTTFRSKLWIPS